MIQNCFLEITCPNKTEVLDSATLEIIEEAMNITEESCSNDYWKAPNGKTMEEAEIILDLKCPTRLETFSIMNGFGNFGTKKFSLWGARESGGPWTKLYTGELPQGTEMTEEVTCFFIWNDIQYHL